MQPYPCAGDLRTPWQWCFNQSIWQCGESIWSLGSRKDCKDSLPHHLPGVSLKLSISSSGPVPHLPGLWTRHFPLNARNFGCFLINCILSHRKCLWLRVNLLRKKTDHTFFAEEFHPNEHIRVHQKRQESQFVNIKIHVWPGGWK